MKLLVKLRKMAKIRNRYNQAPHPLNPHYPNVRACFLMLFSNEYEFFTNTLAILVHLYDSFVRAQPTNCWRSSIVLACPSICNQSDRPLLWTHLLSHLSPDFFQSSYMEYSTELSPKFEYGFRPTYDNQDVGLHVWTLILF